MGILRLFLALCVIAGHAGSDVFGTIGPNWSTYAVLVFFVISGFYMALVTDTKYKNVPVLDFYASRAARIYPTYWLAAIFAAGVLYFQNGAAMFTPFVGLSGWQQAYVVFTNFFVFGQDLSNLICLRTVATGACLVDAQFLLNPPGWSIAVELLFYVLAPFFAKSIGRSACLLGLGIAYSIAVKWVDIPTLQAVLHNPGISLSTTLKYYFFPSSFLFFGAGCCAYYAFYKPSIGKAVPTLQQYAIGVALIVVAAKYADISIAWWQLGMIALTVPSLFSATRFNRYDRLIGEMSYPVYMFHLPVLHICRFYHLGEDSIGSGNAIAIGSILCGIAVYCFIDQPIDRWRHARFAARAPRNTTQAALHFV
jgi:peptidoglycan/LPS O-acetylase OafA/YrhL